MLLVGVGFGGGQTSVRTTSPLTTFSAGAAVHPGGSPEATMKRADEALYEAKRRGRAAGWILPPDPVRREDDGRRQLSLDQQWGGRLLDKAPALEEAGA